MLVVARMRVGRWKVPLGSRETRAKGALTAVEGSISRGSCGGKPNLVSPGVVGPAEMAVAAVRQAFFSLSCPDEDRETTKPGRGSRGGEQ